MVIVFLGPPGVGKGTQAKILAKDQRWSHVSTGDLLRSARREGTDLGNKATAFMDAGELVPDDLIMDLVREYLERGGPGSIFDGFPRTQIQAEGLDEVLAELGRQVDRVVLFEADDELLVKRISGRRSCPDCGAVYNVYFSPARDDGACDHCGKRLVHRADDDADTVRRRLEVYREQTAPLIDYYEGRGPIPIAIDAGRAVDEILRDVRSALGLAARGAEGA